VPGAWARLHTHHCRRHQVHGAPRHAQHCGAHGEQGRCRAGLQLQLASCPMHAKSADAAPASSAHAWGPRGLGRGWEWLGGTPQGSDASGVVGVSGHHAANTATATTCCSCPTAPQMGGQGSLVQFRRPCWVSRMGWEPGEGWRLTGLNKHQGSYDAVVISHNGKCANRWVCSPRCLLPPAQRRHAQAGGHVHRPHWQDTRWAPRLAAHSLGQQPTAHARRPARPPTPVLAGRGAPAAGWWAPRAPPWWPSSSCACACRRCGWPWWHSTARCPCRTPWKVGSSCCQRRSGTAAPSRRKRRQGRPLWMAAPLPPCPRASVLTHTPPAATPSNSTHTGRRASARPPAHCGAHPRPLPQAPSSAAAARCPGRPTTAPRWGWSTRGCPGWSAGP
jgi:hypothetical protein